MAAPVSTIRTGSDFSLAEINTLLEQQESILGPLVTIGNDGIENLLIFDFERDPPEQHTIIEAATSLQGTMVVAIGKMFISGQLQDVAAYRPN
jgi:hypothetical protein